MAKRQKTRRTRRGRTVATSSQQTHVPIGPHGLTRRDMLPILALALLVAVSYFPATQGGFVWDDNIFIVNSDPVQAADGLWRIWFSPSTTGEHHYWPLTYTTFWLEHKLWGFAPVGYHAVNLLLHFVNALLLWRLLLRLSVPGAVFVAAVFAVHPIHVEPVAWIIGRKDLLATLLYLTAVLAYFGFLAEDRPAVRTARYVLALVLFAAGLLCKSTVVTLPAALLIWHWWQQGRIAAGDLVRLSGFFALGLAIVGADWAFYRSKWDSEITYSLIERALLASRILWFYVARLLWPTESPVFYPLWEVHVSDGLAWACLVAAVSVVVLLWRARHRIGRGPLAGVLFFAVTLSPVLGFIDFSYMLFSFIGDRYQYLACAGVISVLIAAAVRAADRLSGVPIRMCQGVACFVLVILGMGTWQQTKIYRDELTFFNHIIAHNPEARSVHLGLSNALLKLGRVEEALAASRIAMERDPNAGGGYINAATALRHLGRPDEAEAILRRFMATGSQKVAHNVLALANLVAGLLERDRIDEAEEHLHRLQTLEPRALIGIELQAKLRFKQGRYAESLTAFQTLVKNNPTNATAHSDMAVVLFQMGRVEEALQSFDRALAIDPTNQTARANREQVRKSLANRRINE